MNPAAIEIQNLHHSYGEHQALAGVNFSIQQGEIFGLLGPNGGGKSTLFRILSTLLLPSSGTARIHGIDVASDPHGVRRHICVVFQSPSLDGRLKVQENLQHQGHLYGLKGADLQRRIEEVLERIGLTSRAKDRVDRLSGGQQRRVEIGKALLHRPEVLLLDEPSTGLDPGVRLEIWDILAELKQKDGLAILISTHLLDEAERCDRVAILHKGRILAVGAPGELRAQIGTDILLLKGGSPDSLAKGIQQRFGVEPKFMDGSLRIEIEHGSNMLIEILKNPPGTIDSVSLGKPTLEDVFLHHTGIKFAQGDS